MPVESSREYSKRLGVLTSDQLQAALTRFDLGELIDAEPAPGGLFGQIVLLITSKGGYALRGNPHAGGWPSFGKDGETTTPGQIQRERYVAEVIHTRTRVPVPWPYLIDESTDIFGWQYALMRRMPGIQLADGDVRKTLTQDDRRGIVVAMAECLAQLHQAAFEWHGAFDAGTGRFEPAAKDYADWFGDWTRWWLEQCRAASPATTDADVRWVMGIIDDAHLGLAEPFAPALVHTDFKENNAVAQQENGVWRIGGLFDLADTHLGDGEYDLARAYCEYATRPELAAAYLRTYLRLRPPRPGFEERFRHYVLHDRLIIWEYGQRNSVWFRPGLSLQEWASPTLTLPAAIGDMLPPA